jgi:hypothetical protein
MAAGIQPAQHHYTPAQSGSRPELEETESRGRRNEEKNNQDSARDSDARRDYTKSTASAAWPFDDIAEARGFAARRYSTFCDAGELQAALAVARSAILSIFVRARTSAGWTHRSAARPTDLDT